MMPLMMRRSSSRTGPGNPVGRYGSIRAHCRSLNQNKRSPTLLLQTHFSEKRITEPSLGTDPSQLSSLKIGITRSGIETALEKPIGGPAALLGDVALTTSSKPSCCSATHSRCRIVEDECCRRLLGH